jgi:nickel-dependent lactate racemase
VIEVALPFGAGTRRIEVPEDATILRPRSLPGLRDPAAAIRAALARPLGGPRLDELVGTGSRVVVVFPDITRPMPNQVVLPPLLAELERAGAGPDHVTLLCATGTHRGARPDELLALVGAEVLERYRVIQHRAEGEHVEVGTVDGIPILLDPRYVEADVRIATGFVEPHFFAGFSGGPKAVCPGLAGLETILEAHSPARISSKRATWLALDYNPVHRFLSRAVELAPLDLCLDVAINEQRELTAVFVGALPSSHRAACAFVERTAVQVVPAAFDVVLTSNAGFPLDRNLYQAVKGMAAAERVVRVGGDIVLVAGCVDGYPSEGPFAGLLQAAAGPDELLGSAQGAIQDGWQAQVLGRVLSKARVHLFTEGLSGDQVVAAHLEPVADPSAAVAELLAHHGPQARLGVLPEGPLSVATVAS